MYINCNLDYNQVGEKGSKGLSRGDWPLLKEIILGKNVLRKAGTNWGSRERPTSQRPSGGGLRQLGLVMKWVNLGGVASGDRGCRWLGRASLKGLTHLTLRIKWLMQRTME